VPTKFACPSVENSLGKLWNIIPKPKMSLRGSAQAPRVHAIGYLQKYGGPDG
jgi:hypothetical protein